jgi:hypothetical protein
MPAGMGSEVSVWLGDSEQKFAAEIQNISSLSIKLWMRTKLDAGARVRIEVSPGFQQSGVVLYSKRDDIGCTTVIDFDRDSARPVRTEVREAHTESATVSELGSRNPPVLMATTIDLSASGVSLRMDQQFELGALVKIELQDWLLFAEVRNCRPDGRHKFRVGFSVEWKIPRTSGALASQPPVSKVGGSLRLALFRVRAFLRSNRRKP